MRFNTIFKHKHSLTASSRTRRAGLLTTAALLATVLVLIVTALPYPFTRPVEAGNPCGKPFISVGLPLNDLGPAEYVRWNGGPTGHIGGLYPDGLNNRPDAHQAAGIAIANAITPLNPAGNPDPANGKIGMISVGMSNTSMEFSGFVAQANSDPDKNDQLIIVDGAQFGKASDAWVRSDAETWDILDQRLNAAGLTPAQVVIAWVKQAQIGPGPFPSKPQSLQEDLEQIARNLKFRYPNIQMTFYSSRTRSYNMEGDNGGQLSPEPTAFETAFAVRWMLERQINGDADLNYDPNLGPVLAPYLSWGPYLWADGTNPRSDGFTWEPTDLNVDCTHPSDNGVQKVTDLLLDYFKNDVIAMPWFLENPPPPGPPTPTPTAGPPPTPTATPDYDAFHYLPVIPRNYQPAGGQPPTHTPQNGP